MNSSRSSRPGIMPTQMPAGFPAHAAERRFEDYLPGAVFEFGSVTVSRDEIIDFAQRYDPQAMHVDPAWAETGPFGEVIASGWHTVSLMMRMFVEHFLPEGGLAAPGIDELRWPRPVRPGDTLRVRVTVQEARVSRSKPDRGLIIGFVEVLNQHHEPVLTMKPMNLVRRRVAPEQAAPR